MRQAEKDLAHTRYSNFHPTEEGAERAIRYAEEIIQYCKSKISKNR